MAAHRLGQMRHRRRGESGAGNTCVVEGYVCVAGSGVVRRGSQLAEAGSW